MTDMRPTLPEPPSNDDPMPHIPKCPDWCEGGHGNEDGGVDEEGILHVSRAAFGTFLPDIRNAVGGGMLRSGGYEVVVSLKRKDLWSGKCGHEAVCLESSMLQLDEDNSTIHRGRVETPLMSGEARSLAAAPIRFADIADGLTS